MMVPMADMLNHVSKHNANLEYTPVCGADVLLFLIVNAFKSHSSHVPTGVPKNGVRTAHWKGRGGL